MLANISMFESIGSSGPQRCVINNSDASVLLQVYDQSRKSLDVCDKYIEEMQKEEFVPADVISQMYSAKERFTNELMKLKQQVIEQIAKVPVDAYDRETYFSLSKTSQDDLHSVVNIDEVVQRALEIKSAEQSAQAGAPSVEMAEEAVPAEEPSAVKEATLPPTDDTSSSTEEAPDEASKEYISATDTSTVEEPEEDIAEDVISEEE